ncbi:nitronate monooxygenase [Simonsiella muelleri]|uniref:NAD(P)H-dependent flavin oxidoreductase n=1 Tax=Simonsiella muelleri TaxID=72 RepID=UPI0028D58A38|nr:nitronate monooxygenase [Simonsiella muelleri]
MSISSLVEKLKLRLPIVQAPMAGGATTPELVSAVSEAGALGFIGGGYLIPQDLIAHAEAVRAKTGRPFGINLFVLTREQSTRLTDPMPAWLTNVYHRRGLPLPKQPQALPIFDDQFEALLNIQPAVASFSFGILNDEHVRALKAKNIAIVGTANHAEEAKYWEDIGADAVCVQGAEAGGHRGGFTEQYVNQPMGLMSLMTQCRQSVRIPLWAAGGLMTGQAVAAVRNMGAEAAQMGTAFLSTRESGINRAYKNALFDVRRAITAHTKLFTGKPARMLINRYIRENMANENNTASYPQQHAYTQSLRSAAAQQGDVEYMALYAGKGVGLCRDMRVADLIDALEKEYLGAIGAELPENNHKSSISYIED